MTIAAGPPDQDFTSPLGRRTVLFIRVVCVAVAINLLGLVITGIPIRYDKVRSLDPDIRVAAFRNLIRIGVSPDIAAACDVGANLVVFTALFAGGAFLFLRSSASRAAMFLALALMLHGASYSGLTSVHRTTGPPFSQTPVGLLTTLFFFFQSSATFIAMFWLPEGRFAFRWTAWLTALLLVIICGIYLLLPYPLAHDAVNLVGLPAVVLSALGQIAHYRRVAKPEVRERLKWAVIGILVASVGFFTNQALLMFANQPGIVRGVVGVAGQLLESITQIALLVFFGIAIIRYRLWPVDLVINRSLVYGTVSLLLLVIFLAGTRLLQIVLGPDYGWVAFVVSTASIAFLFNPARNHIQHIIDRRLYGFRFDLNELRRAQDDTATVGTPLPTAGTLGPYRILRVLGRGGMGDVYQGERDGRLVAIKALPQDVAGQEFLKWFEREARVLATINHPRIVRFYESSESNGKHYMVLEFIEGRDLGQIIKERARLPFAEALPLVGDVADALDYVHERGLVHRDVKPSNIMVRPSTDRMGSEAVLMDFGIAAFAEAHTGRTRTGAIGTIRYMAPEQIMAAATIDHRADVYAFGVSVYEMLAGDPPFQGSPAQILFAHLNQSPADLKRLVPDLPTQASRSVMRCLEKHPNDRFQSVGDFARAFTGVSVPDFARS